MSWQTFILHLFTYGILLYSIVILICYFLIGAFSIGETSLYLNKNSFTDYRVLASSNEAPSMSILAPAYNEASTIIENVRSLLSLHYHNLEVIIINDGSKDDSLEKLIGAYDLYKIDFFVNEQIKTKPVKAVYKSRNPVYRKLIVVDKVSGGKADALNVGVNVAKNDYYVCIDVDCVLEQDAILKLAKPFLETSSHRVIAAGGVVRIANSCNIEDGHLVKVNLPKKFLPRVQTLEYIRAFLLSRMAWTRLNGLLLISGAFGAFDRDIVIKCGGYNPNTVGEDMELVVRMRRYMEELDEPYRVSFIPDPLCWTEAPSTYRVLGRQRNRWTRGTIETLRTHRKMFFNPKYGLMGMLSYPYWLFFEFLAPIIEFFGTIGLIVYCFTYQVNWQAIIIMIGVICIGILYSIFAILMEVITYNQYKQHKDILRLVLVAILEPFIFHPFVTWSAIMGNIDLLRKRNSWGEMTRTGFATEKKVIMTLGNEK
ncbi:MAG: glycosyltransferase family 2 protein [Mucilaginibacter sp.]